MDKRFFLGIDLGTSHCAAAGGPFYSGACDVVDLHQPVSASALAARSLLPSVGYLVPEAERSGAMPSLPWKGGDSPTLIYGDYARERGSASPDRVIVSAKSWLSNPHVDPKSRALPWGSEAPESEKRSAYEVSRDLLETVCGSFFHESFASNWPIEEGSVVVTVPASFDQVARNLTLDAAREAGFVEPAALEEPQAAFYAWVDQAGTHWRQQVSAGDLVLVCDVGGGTSDFSLIAIQDRDGDLELQRVSVGEHILLGGDNIDLALAYTLQAKLKAEGKKIDAWQLRALTLECRRAKEGLLSQPELNEYSVSIPSRGSSLFSQTLSVSIERSLVDSIVFDGFLPMTGPDERPVEQSTSALQEFGLAYAADPVISKHLARFLGRSLENVASSPELRATIGERWDAAQARGMLLPTAVLFNGGFFNAGALRQRVLDLLASWGDGAAPRALDGCEPDLAVARGAAVYARMRVTGEGLRIRAGTARSYYLGLESSMPAIPGFTPPVKAVCVAPQGMEEGSEVALAGREFGLTVGKEAAFRFFSSEVRAGDASGTILEDAEDVLEETAGLTVCLPPSDGLTPGSMVPVRMSARVTEVGALELWMRHDASGGEWKVDFQVRTE